MKLIDRRMEITKPFSSLKAGDCFYYPNEQWYGMKLYTQAGSGDTAVDIETGELALLHNSDEVVPVNAHIAIE